MLCSKTKGEDQFVSKTISIYIYQTRTKKQLTLNKGTRCGKIPTLFQVKGLIPAALH